MFDLTLQFKVEFGFKFVPVERFDANYVKPNIKVNGIECLGMIL